MPARLVQFDIVDKSAGRLRPIVAQTLFGFSCTLVLIGVRVGIDAVAPTAGPFALIYPATLISTLYGRWRAGLVTFISAFAWVWFTVLPRDSTNGLLHPDDGPRLTVNFITVLVILVFAELFRAQVRRATRQRDIAFGEVSDLNENLEYQVAERTRVQSQTWLLSPDMLGVLNPEGYFEKTNPAWQTILGWSEQHIGKTKFFEFIHPDDLERTHGAWEIVSRGQPVLRFENRYRDTDGNWHWLSWVVVPEDGKFYGSAREITAEKEAALSLGAAEEALRQSQKLEAIGQLTGGVAHDFNNLLTVIVGSIDLLRKPELSEGKRTRYIEAIGDTAARAAKLTGQLLAFARRQSLTPETFDAGAAIVEVSTMIETLVGSRIDFARHVPDEPCLVLADRSQFDTAIVNLAINARDAMQNEGHLTIRAGPVSGIPEVRGEAPIAGDFVGITVADTGSGIPPDDLVRIFEPFFTTKPAGEGTGLGLSQLIGFAKQSGGEIRVDSIVGKGTVFTLYLPRVIAPQLDVAPAERRDEAIDGAGFCVLIVEDNAQVGEFVTNALKELGYDSILARDAERALAELESGCDRFHIVFSDVVMPGMDGLELGQQIRKLYPDLPIILTSGYSHVLAENGTHGFELLHKPYSVDQLSRVFRKALALHRAE